MKNGGLNNVVAAKRGAEYGRDFKTITFQVSPDEHQAFRIRAATYGLTVSDVCRLALADEAMWKRAAKIKAQQTKEKEGGK